MIAENDWTVSLQTGGRPLAHAAVLTPDGRHCLVLFTHQLRVYYVATRQCVRTVALAGADVVDFGVSAANPSHCVLFRAAGTVSIVNWRDKNAAVAVLETVLDGAPVLRLVALSPTHAVVVCGKPGRHTPHTRTVARIDLATGLRTELAAVENVLRSAASPNAATLAFVTSTNEVATVVVRDLAATTHTAPFAFRSQVSAVAVADDGTVALGTASGAIQVLYPHAPQRLLKWHIDRVAALRFSPDNKYLMSGGAERVLVFWQLATDKTQFLPRLNGAIEEIGATEEHYTLRLAVGGAARGGVEFEHVVLSAVDLASRLAVSGARPAFASPVTLMERLTKRMARQNAAPADPTRLRYDFTAPFAVHPLLPHAYFPAGPQIQVYDMARDEQSHVQIAGSTSQSGKVRAEVKVAEPQTEHLAFTACGGWMCTAERLAAPPLGAGADAAGGAGAASHALRFWRYVAGSGAGAGAQWELCTKVVAPHGDVGVALLIAAPLAYHGGLAFLTADAKGGVRLWRPRGIAAGTSHGSSAGQTAWTLRKSRPSGAVASTAVALAWSADASVAVVAHEASMTPLDVTTFTELAPLPALTGLRIRALEIVGHHLVALSKTRLVAYNLLAAQETPLVCRVSIPTGGKNLLAVDHKRNLVAVVVNHHTATFAVRAKLYVFHPERLEPVHVTEHPQAIASIRYVPRSNAFVFVDLDTCIGTLGSAAAELVAPDQPSAEAVAQDFATEMAVLLQSAQATARVTSTAAVGDDDMAISTVVNANTFDAAFENLEGVSMENLFERIVKALA